MNGFEINRAARMLRAGNAFSETNKKLQEAMYCFIEWLFQVVTEYQLPPVEEFGWGIKRKDNRRICLSFRMGQGGWHSVISRDDSPLTNMNSIVLCCRALAGPEGEKLIAWLEKEALERNEMLTALQSALKVFRSSVRV
ncbi:MAG: hypothetical protein LiPW39_561 [Parcubacteria group bacterium LiPW_39]|nr:MAG: hypothetical protein LiPW39_561 [Parcubacteria group bacterium LiPW_39]